MKFLAIGLLLESLWIQSSNGYPSGAPLSACSTLTPVHRSNNPQSSDPPYKVTATKTGNKVQVTISGTDMDFQGFVIQARYARNRNRLAEGKFTSKQGLTQTIDCHNGRQNTLTQVNTERKNRIVTEWTADKGVNDDVIFRATVAKSFQEFWINIDSNQIRMAGQGESSSKSNQRQEFGSQKMYDDCFVNKGCFGYPADCIVRRDCEIFLSYVNTGEGVTFTMIGSLGSSQNYMASALSTDRRMGDDYVTECFMDDGRVMLQHSWNEGKTNTPLKLVPEGMYEWQFENGLARCSWTSPYTFNGGTVESKRYSLNNSTYYMLIAKGPMSSGRVGYHNGKLSSQESVNFTAYEEIEGEGAHDAVKVHGAFMVTGWVAFVSLAILLARHFKNDWDDQTICGVKIWFAVHRGLMIAALAFIIVAFIVIFVHIDGWNYETRNPHAILGCIATALGVFQPIMAAFRPSPDQKKRPIFNWLHWGVGNLAQIIAVVAIFFTPALESSGLKTSFYWVMGVFVIIHCFFHFLFQLHVWKGEKKKSNEMKMQTMGSGRVAPSGQTDKNGLAGSVIRGLLLGVYGIFLTVIMLALYALIGTA